MDRPLPDSPVSNKDQDMLRRWPFAREIYELIRQSPKEWCLRIGVYGRWGEGKTTVLSFIEEFARGDGNMVVWFNPWAAEDRFQLWTSFALAIEEGTRVPIPKWKKLLSYVPQIFRFGETVAGLDPDLAPIGKAFHYTANKFKKGFSIKKRDVEKLLKQVDPGNTKLIILIDDLDRSQPALVPHLLLSLRELFEFPRCAFVLGLDPSVVAESLPLNHPGWGATSEFLNKIVNFPFYLPPAQEQDLLRLVNSEIKNAHLDIDQFALGEIVDLLPKNPRKLKQFLRGLWRFKNQLERHGKDEIDWPMLLFVELMRSISFRAAGILSQDKEIWEELLQSQFSDRTTQSELIEEKIKQQEKWETRMNSLLEDDQEVKEEEKKEIKKVLQRMKDIISWEKWDNLLYWTKLCEDPTVFTWKEFNALFEKLRSDFKKEKVENLVREHASRTDLSVPIVERDLFVTAINYRERELAKASESGSHKEMAAYLKMADEALMLLRRLIWDFHGFSGQDPVLRSAEFQKLFSHFKGWAHWLNDDLYREARAKEKAILLQAAKDSDNSAIEILNNLKIWDSREYSGFFEGEGRKLAEDVAKILSPQVFVILRERFSRINGIKTLWGSDRHLVEKHYLFDGQSGFYTEDLVSYLRVLSEKAKEEQYIHANFLEFISMLEYGLSKGLGWVKREGLETLASNREVISVIWQGVLSNEPQPRILKSLREDRDKLVYYVGDEILRWPDKWDISTGKSS